jgi:hypothetical protein
MRKGSGQRRHAPPRKVIWLSSFLLDLSSSRSEFPESVGSVMSYRPTRGRRNEEGFRPEAAFTAAKCLAFLFPPGPFLLAQRVPGKRRRGDVAPADARQEE